MGKPQQLTKQQVEEIKKQNDGSPMLKEIITVKDGVGFSRDLDIRENDVLFLNLVRL
jgi:xylan 1,4-beta-xylosidase